MLTQNQKDQLLKLDTDYANQIFELQRKWARKSMIPLGDDKQKMIVDIMSELICYRSHIMSVITQGA